MTELTNNAGSTRRNLGIDLINAGRHPYLGYSAIASQRLIHHCVYIYMNPTKKNANYGQHGIVCDSKIHPKKIHSNRQTRMQVA